MHQRTENSATDFETADMVFYREGLENLANMALRRIALNPSKDVDDLILSVTDRAIQPRESETNAGLENGISRLEHAITIIVRENYSGFLPFSWQAALAVGTEVNDDDCVFKCVVHSIAPIDYKAKMSSELYEAVVDLIQSGLVPALGLVPGLGLAFRVRVRLRVRVQGLGFRV